MKKLLLSVFVLAVLTSSAQITLQPGDMGNIGYSVRRANDTIPTATPGTPGANQTWNFTNIQNHFTDTLTFTNPNWIPGGSSFPNSNLAVMLSAVGPSIFLINNSTLLSVDGQYADFGFGPTAIDLNPNEQVMSWPCTYNTTFNNVSKFQVAFPFPQPPADSLRVRETKIKNSICDAWGSLTTNLGTFNVLRIKETIYTYDTTEVHVTIPVPSWQPAQTSGDTSYHYTFWTNNVNNNAGFPLVELNADVNNIIVGASYLMSLAQTGIDDDVTNENLPVYPNPAVTSITFNTNGVDVSQIRILDINGKEVMLVPVNGNGVEVSTVDLSAGTYFYLAVDKNNSVRRAGKFNISK
jgi:hypothetical protein